MCNIAGYVGTKPAAPILIEMMRREEGWDAGFYTGIATVCDGKLHADKVVGDLDRLLEMTDAADFPGTVGFLHSRSKGGGNVGWAHPFISTDKKLAYIANGCDGVFRNAAREYSKHLLEELVTEGYQFGSKSAKPVGNYPVLPDGGGVHSSDVMCQCISRNIASGMDTMAAMEKSMCLRPSEVIGLVLREEEPDCISWARTNYPMFVGYAPHGMYMATTPQAFPEDARNVTLLNPMSCGRVYADRIVSKFFEKAPGTVAPVTPEVWHDCYDEICRAISEREMDHDELCMLVKPLFDEADCVPDAAVVYWIESVLFRRGKLGVNRYRVPGQQGLTAPKFKAYLKGK